MTLTLNKPSYAPRFINHSHCTLKHLTQRQVFGSDQILSSDSVREVVLLSWKILVSPDIFFSQDGLRTGFKIVKILKTCEPSQCDVGARPMCQINQPAGSYLSS